MKGIHAFPALATLPLLAACVETGPSVAPGSDRPNVRAVITDTSTEEVRPGTRIPGPIEAGLMFKSICMDTRPSLAAARKAVEADRFRESPTTGTYFHRDFDLSIKLIREDGGACSMVFASAGEPTMDAAWMAVAAGVSEMELAPSESVVSANLSDNSMFVVRPASQSEDRTYFHALNYPRN